LDQGIMGYFYDTVFYDGFTLTVLRKYRLDVVTYEERDDFKS
jgi:hypothetical protein